MFLLKFLLFLSVTVHLSAASCLQFISTASVPEAKYTVEGVVNREQFISYKDNIGEIIPEWMLKIRDNDPDHWIKLTDRLKHDLQTVREDVNTTSPDLINTKGDHMLKEKFGCELYNNGTERRFWKFVYDDEVLISLDLNGEVWTAETRPDEFNMQQWEDTDTARFRKDFLQHECIDWLQKYVKHNPAAGFLKFISTANTPGTGFTVEGRLDGEKIVFYDSNSGEIIPETEWIKKIKDEHSDHWSKLTKRLKHDLQRVSKDVNTASPDLINTEGDHTVKEIYGYERYNNGTVRRFWKFVYDDEDLISLNLNDEVWTAETRPAKFNMQQWEDTDTARYRRDFLQDECIGWLQKYLEYKRAAGSQSDSGLTQNNWCEPERKTIPPPPDAGDAANQKSGNGSSVPGVTAGVMVLIALIAGVVVGVGVMMWKKNKEQKPGSLQFISTAETPGTGFTVMGRLNDEKILSYDSNSGEVIPETEWMKKIKDKYPGRWGALTRRLNHDLQSISEDVNTSSPNLINTKGVHTVQEKFGYKLYNNGTERRFWKFVYDDEDLITMNLNDEVWTAETRTDEFNMQQWEDTKTAENRRFFLQFECIDWLQMCVEYKRAAEPYWCRRVLNNLCKPKEDTRPPAEPIFVSVDLEAERVSLNPHPEV